MIESGENVTIFAPKDSAMACRVVERMVARRNQTGFSGFDGWVSFVLSHVCDDLHDPDDLAQREEVSFISVPSTSSLQIQGHFYCWTENTIGGCVWKTG